MPHIAFIISFMENGLSHAWDLDITQARDLQKKLSHEVIRYNPGLHPRLIAGIDVSISRFSKVGRAAVVVLSYSSLELIEVSVLEGNINFPYIPGLLSFREAPLIIEAWQKLKTHPDLLMVDGQGIAHPRRLGIASHLGLLLNMPSIGCAKSRLTGDHTPLPNASGSCSWLTDGEEVIGAVVRTKRSVTPLYISIGHKIDLASSVAWVLNCCCGFRLPQPTRLAHMAARGSLIHPEYKHRDKSIKIHQE